MCCKEEFDEKLIDCVRSLSRDIRPKVSSMQCSCAILSSVAVGRENIFKPTIGQESLHRDNNDNGVRLDNFATSKNLVVKSKMFLHRNIHKYTWTSSEGKTHNQIDQELIGRRWHSSVLEARSFRGVDCGTDYKRVIVRVRERLAVDKQVAQRFDRQRFNLRKLMSQRLGNSIRLRLQTGLQLCRT